jgi:hypothetical protein
MGFGADPTVALQSLDLPGALDHPQGVDVGVDVLQLEVGEAAPELLHAPGVLGGIRAIRIGHAACDVDGHVRARLVHLGPLGEPDEECLRASRADAGQVLVEVRQWVNLGEAVAFGRALLVEHVPSIPARLPCGLGRQEESRRAICGIHHQDGVQILIARQVVEVVVLTESDAGGHLGLAEHHDETLTSHRIAQCQPASREFLRGKLHSLCLRFRHGDEKREERESRA